MSKFRRYFNQFKPMEISNIINSIKSKIVKANDFLRDSPETTDDLKRDYMLLGKLKTSEVVNDLIENNETVICNLKDRDGKIGLKVASIDREDIDSEEYLINLVGGKSHFLYDRFLYNVKWVSKRKEFSLEEHDEYFEKIEVRNDEN